LRNGGLGGVAAKAQKGREKGANLLENLLATAVC